MLWAQAACDGVQHRGSCGLELAIHQTLRLFHVLQPDEAVVAPGIAVAGGIYRPCQPFPAVEADVYGKREPSLDAGMHEAKGRVHLVMVEMQAFAVARLQFDGLGSAVARDLIRQAWLDRGQDADLALLDVVRPDDFAGLVFFVDGARIQIVIDRAMRLASSSGASFSRRVSASAWPAKSFSNTRTACR